MSLRTLFFTLLCAGLFLAAFVSGREWGNEKTTQTTAQEIFKPARFSLSSPHMRNSSRNISQDSSQKDFFDFVKKLKGNITPEECEKIFEEEMKISNFNPNDRYCPRTKMLLLLDRWGEINPRAALQKMQDASVPQSWITPVFESWAARKPEAARAFYDESQHNFIKNNPSALQALVSSWAKLDLPQTMAWIQDQKSKNLSDKEIKSLKALALWQQSTLHPEKIPQFITQYAPELQRRHAQQIGLEWGSYTTDSPEWINHLPEKAQIQAKVGRIMGMTEGKLDAIKNQITQLDEEEQKRILPELANPLLTENQLDTKERLAWLVEKLPVNSWEFLNYELHDWVLDNREEAAQWIDSLPEGEKKETLKNLKLKDRHGCIFR